jgi:DNA-binding XRE family transcriptional regulator
VPSSNLTTPGDFDVIALCEAVEAQRASRNLKWGPTVFRWMSRSTMERMRERGTATCNHVLPMIQWVGRTPESFTVDPDGAVHELLPDPQGQWRWWWAHHDLASAVDAQRQERGMTWKQAADEMGVGTAAIQGLTKLRYGPSIGLAMIAARWIQRSAASFLTELPPSAFNRYPR